VFGYTVCYTKRGRQPPRPVGTALVEEVPLRHAHVGGQAAVTSAVSSRFAHSAIDAS
jgi:hypothetical protein